LFFFSLFAKAVKTQKKAKKEKKRENVLALMRAAETNLSPHFKSQTIHSFHSSPDK
jgi:hypothetical protein